MTIKVTAPASTANLGPGFDSLAAALTLPIEIQADPSAEPTSSGGLIEEAIQAAAGTGRPIGRITVRSEIPRGRGLGSSGACIAAGLVLGCALADKEPVADDLLALGTEIEGHPDNVAASLFGGVVCVLPGQTVLRFDPSPSVRPVILLPDNELPTAEARRVLPDQVTRSDAVASLSRTAGLLALLSGSTEVTPARLLECTEDVLHQPYRAPLMPDTAEAISHLRARGFAAAVSGAGPSVVCLVVRGEEEGFRGALSGLSGWEVLEADWDRQGARIIGS